MGFKFILPLATIFFALHSATVSAVPPTRPTTTPASTPTTAPVTNPTATPPGAPATTPTGTPPGAPATTPTGTPPGAPPTTPTNPTTPAAPTTPAGAPPTNPGSTEGPPTIPGFTLTFAEEFDSASKSLPSAENWIIDTGHGYPGGPLNWGTGEIQEYTSNIENVNVEGGILSITAIKGEGNKWTSSRIETQRKDFVAAPNGKMRIQARISMPDVTGPEAIGYWPAFWTLGGDYRGNFQNWPAIGEFDIMENVNGIDKVTGVIHCGIAPGGPCNEMDGISSARQCPNTPCQGNFHTYSLEVDRTKKPESLTYSVDDVPFHTVLEDSLPADVWTQSVHEGHFILLNLAMGGAFPDKVHGSATPIESTVSGKSLQVDYVAVYNSA